LGGSVFDQGSTGNHIETNTIADMANDEAIFIGQNCNANSVTGNTIDGANVGIQIWKSNGQTVTGNTVRNCGGAYYHGTGYSAVGIRLRNAQNNTITGNTVILNMKGFEIVANEAPYCTGNHINSNNISGNGSAMDVVNGGNVVDAISNWWGAESGPLDNKTLDPGVPAYNNLSGLGNSVGSFANYKPFWMNEVMTIDSTITVTVTIANGTHNATVPVTVQFGNSLTLTATPSTYYYVYSTTRGIITTVLPFTNRMLGLPQALTFDNITGTLPDRTATVAINIFRRGDIGPSGPDGHVKVEDASILIQQWRKTIADLPDALLADLNCDDVVNVYDLSMMMSLWQP
jgi:parallel beta-helix repeat protein